MRPRVPPVAGAWDVGFEAPRRVLASGAERKTISAGAARREAESDEADCRRDGRARPGNRGVVVNVGGGAFV